MCVSLLSPQRVVCPSCAGISTLSKFSNIINEVTLNALTRSIRAQGIGKVRFFTRIPLREEGRQA